MDDESAPVPENNTKVCASGPRKGMGENSSGKRGRKDKV